MWALLVVLVPEAIEDALLRPEAAGRLDRLNGVLLERSVHAFVSAVLRWLATLDAFGLDAELNPPHCELADAVRGRKRCAVVGAKCPRQPKLRKSRLKHLLGREPVWMLERLTAC